MDDRELKKQFIREYRALKYDIYKRCIVTFYNNSSFSYKTIFEVDQLFLNQVFKLPDYGEERYHAKVNDSLLNFSITLSIYFQTLETQAKLIGISPIGISVYGNTTKTFEWSKYISSYEMFGSLVITYTDCYGEKKCKMIKTSDNGFLIDLIKRNECAYKWVPIRQMIIILYYFIRTLQKMKTMNQFKKKQHVINVSFYNLFGIFLKLYGYYFVWDIDQEQ